MDGMTRTEVDKAEAKDFALGKGPLRPRDAATLILLERRDGEVRVLMGRRHARHAFMPGKFVFPGGRTDPEDGRIPVAQDLHPDEQAKLTSAARIAPARARAIALSAVRETYEEAGLLIGRAASFQTRQAGWLGFAEHNVAPALDGLRYIARAITPPGRVRRFDTRFLAAWRDSVAVELPQGGPTGELEELAWLPLAEARQADIPAITGTVLGELEQRLTEDPLLRPGGPVPFYRMVRNRFVRELL
ncbi:NUDIX hydrolase [Kumtagia ephedrae]|jgi:8-oxo-dGTP pyrophosphatase MutT (NUDIX family)|uniref:NUDIX hydrolase n=1 Tax=Kumtagia ephedrae TaxID=2116701 RepID=A0A2P7SH76_9HYPH|nr:NUDIX domain-containing protein [Mesorhizobium ephedrae]PSJ61843.1 NUDIX hydrolase [Mesorhizobium ephedrae]